MSDDHPVVSQPVPPTLTDGVCGHWFREIQLKRKEEIHEPDRLIEMQFHSLSETDGRLVAHSKLGASKG